MLPHGRPFTSTNHSFPAASRSSTMKSPCQRVSRTSCATAGCASSGTGCEMHALEPDPVRVHHPQAAMGAPRAHAVGRREAEDAFADAGDERLYEERHPLGPFRDGNLQLRLVRADPFRARRQLVSRRRDALGRLEDDGERSRRPEHLGCLRRERRLRDVEAGRTRHTHLKALVKRELRRPAARPGEDPAGAQLDAAAQQNRGIVERQEHARLLGPFPVSDVSSARRSAAEACASDSGAVISWHVKWRLCRTADARPRRANATTSKPASTRLQTTSGAAPASANPTRTVARDISGITAPLD